LGVPVGHCQTNITRKVIVFDSRYFRLCTTRFLGLYFTLLIELRLLTWCPQILVCTLASRTLRPSYSFVGGSSTQGSGRGEQNLEIFKSLYSLEEVERSHCPVGTRLRHPTIDSNAHRSSIAMSVSAQNLIVSGFTTVF
jgi:hypothetical protein